MARINKLITSGTFSLDGGTWDVDNNVWIIGDDETCVVIDPAHDALEVQKAVNGRQVLAILLTHGHDDHIRAVKTFRSLVDAPVLLHADDRMLWDSVYPDQAPDGTITDGEKFTVAGIQLTALHTPGHSPGSVCFHSPELVAQDGTQGVLFSGDTLFQGGPGATGRSYSDFGTIIESIKNRLFTLPAETVVNTGHGDSTTIGAEAPHLQEWIDRGN
ncbi:MBL fold metallo-hydrolase [Citricoccus nitrophenolicus]|uniref:MBL fold metallo-hydrolase n=1 Tax=Citricoccus nitrophenolicus TaxID=863575 RepID=UPI0031E78666